MPRVRTNKNRRRATTNGNGEIEGIIFGSEWTQEESSQFSIDITFAPGEISRSLGLTIPDDKIFDGNRAIVITIDEDAPFGFSQEVYVFNEDRRLNENPALLLSNPDDNLASDTSIDPVAISLTLTPDSPIRATTLIIEDDQRRDRILKGSDDNDNLTVPDDTTVSSPRFGSYGYAIYGEAGHDTLTSRGGADNLHGGQGSDRLESGDNNDFLAGNSGNDVLRGAADNDVLDGGRGDDRLEGGSGSDSLFGWSGNDVLNGEADGDSLSGEAGSDYLSGGGDFDTLEGGSGADRFDFYNPADRVDEVTDFNAAEGDKIGIYIGSGSFKAAGLSASFQPAQFRLGKVATTATHRLIYDRTTGDLFFDADGTGATLPIAIATLVTQPTLSSTDIRTFGEGDRTPPPGSDPPDAGLPDDSPPDSPGNGDPDSDDPDSDDPDTQGSDILTGSRRNDRLVGDSGHDRLEGKAGNDLLKGQAGNDLLIGGLGSDRYLGGRGRDIFAIEKGSGTDTILDFKDRQDKLGLGKGIKFRKLTIESQGRQTLISLGNDSLALLKGVKASQITLADITSIPNL
ncbi:MAG TPA: calcium-binding protein [Coleofasciculaceae cyanobacterium]|jgi:hypothetical protein